MDKELEKLRAEVKALQDRVQYLETMTAVLASNRVVHHTYHPPLYQPQPVWGSPSWHVTSSGARGMQDAIGSQGIGVC